MNYNKLRASRVGIALTTALAAVVLTGCGDDENHIKPIRVPADAIDLGDNPVNTGDFLIDTRIPGRSFSVPSNEAGSVYCGGIIHADGYLIGSGHSTPQEEDFDKHVRAVSADTSQIDCLYDDWFTDFSYVQEHMTVQYVNTPGSK